MEFDALEGFDMEDGTISMIDEDGNEIGYSMLATKKDGGDIYMLVEEDLPDDSSHTGELEAEVLIFKCVMDSKNNPVSSSVLVDEMIFELVDEDHESFELAFLLFKGDFDALGIEY